MTMVTSLRSSLAWFTVVPLFLMNTFLILRRDDALRNASSLTELAAAAALDAPGTVQFRPFLKDPQLHNTTVLGEALPGPFYGDRIFLLGARLTTSYLDTNHDVHVDVFGFPGDWFTRVTNHEPDIPGCTLPDDGNNDNTTTQQPVLLPNYVTYQEFRSQRVGLFCQLECTNSRPCGPPIPMSFIPLESGDPNQEDTTLIWRCNVTKLLKRRDLHDAAVSATRGEGGRRPAALRVHLYLNESYYVRRGNSFVADLTKIDIPLHTGVAGHAGPQLRSRRQGYPWNIETPLQVGLCMDIYGTKARRYLPEFVQHHKNVGVDQILIGMEATLGSDYVESVQELLRPYVEEGFVVLQATGLNSYFDCYFDFHKLHFYHQCLYHFKGIAKYSATWDVDEYWIPPGTLEVTGRNEYRHEHEGYPGPKLPRRRLSSSSVRDIKSLKTTIKSAPSAFSPLATSDPLWRSSPYAESISIQDVLKAVESYHDHHGCGAENWCYHLFPSYTVHLMKQLINEGGTWRTHRAGKDFYRRDEEGNKRWQKGVANTQIAMMGGIHLPGSCKYPDDDTYYEFSREEACLPHRFLPEAYGALHHFMSLMRDRYDTWVEEKKELPKDEYVLKFAKTVEKQLDQIYDKREQERWKTLE